MISDIIKDKHYRRADELSSGIEKSERRVLNGGLPAILALTMNVAHDVGTHHLVDERLAELLPTLGWNFTHRFTNLLVGKNPSNHLFYRDKGGTLWPHSKLWQSF